MNKRILLLGIVFGALLSACDAFKAGQIEAQGQQYADMSAADQAALDAEQARQFKAQDQAFKASGAQYKQDLWNSWKPVVVNLGIFAFAMLYVPAFVFALALAYGSGLSIVGTSKAFVRVLTVYSGVVPIDRETRLPRTILFDAPALPFPADSFLGRFQERTGIRLVNTNSSKWIAMNAGTGQVMARFDEDKPADTHSAEVLRQAILTFIVANKQMYSGVASPKGDVAEAIGGASFTVPGQSLLFDMDDAVEKIAQKLIGAK